jgi:hypothetical protein
MWTGDDRLKDHDSFLKQVAEGPSLRSDIHLSSVAQAPAVETEGDQRETQDARWNQHIIGLGKPRSQSDSAEHDD